MSEVHVLVGTNNPGKFADAQFVAQEFPAFNLYSPHDLGITVDPEETGTTYSENAHIKRDFYVGKLALLCLKDYFVVADDSGLEIDALGGQPGVHSRRWKDGVTPMSDSEIIAYCLEQMEDIPGKDRGAAFRGVVSVGHASRPLSIDVPFQLQGSIVKAPEGTVRSGYPFNSLFFLPQYGMMMADIIDQPREKGFKGFRTHREIGLKAAFDSILELSHEWREDERAG